MNVITQAEQNELVDKLRELAQKIGAINVPENTATGIEGIRQHSETAVLRMEKQLAQEEFQAALVTLMNSTLEGTPNEQFGNAWGHSTI